MDTVLVSHPLCPYVQRAAIVLAEKGVQYERRDIDLAAKPDWFLAVSPLGKTPVLLAGGAALFESTVICEYLDETHAPRLHPSDALLRVADFGMLAGLPRTAAWRAALAARPSVRQAVAANYPDRLRAFLLKRGAALSVRMVR